ncbi:hypothetical protein D9615_000845 [Tricholomella constricta]|uniref:Nucleoporin NUP188 n=1 Tax=Tricholomella constricta TaxID=117010 RepID=A0A8H5HSJ1_9AGAR|nr:hypothetical protein D9615_000845 [Tricholomella constricta]
MHSPAFDQDKTQNRSSAMVQTASSTPAPSIFTIETQLSDDISLTKLHDASTAGPSPHLEPSNSSIATVVSLPLSGKEKIESSALEDQTHIWAGYEQDILPDKTQGRFLRNIRHQILYLYRRIFGVVFLANFGLFVAVAVRGANAAQLGKIVIANLFVAILMRQDYVVDAFFAVFTAVPSSWPMFIRRFCAQVYHIGGIHSGTGVSGVLWLILFSAQATIEMLQHKQTSAATVGVTYAILALLILILIFAYPIIRVKFHDNFEVTHRFMGWTVTALVWVQVVLLANDYKPAEQPLGKALLRSAPFWMIAVMTASIILPWLRLRKVQVRPEVLSSHALRLYFDYVTPQQGSFVRISNDPWTEWHSFATIPEPGMKGFSVIISKAGDWTTEQIAHPRSRMWIRGIPTFGVMRIVTMFRSIVLVATGSGIAPCAPAVLEKRIPIHLLWTAPNIRETFGDKLVDSLLTASPSAVIYNTRKHGKPDMVKLTYRMVQKTNAEAVIIISNKTLTDKVVYGMRSREHLFPRLFEFKVTPSCSQHNGTHDEVHLLDMKGATKQRSTAYGGQAGREISSSFSATVMSGELTKRSNLIDVTYQQLHSILSGHHEGVHLEQITEYLEPRKSQLEQLSQPFGKPSDASRKKIETGSVTLADGVVVRLEEPDKEFIFAISAKFQIDEIQALVLMRSFLYNEGLPSTAESTSTSSMVAELVEAITPFYYSERLSVFRVLIPLFRALENSTDPIYTIAAKLLPKLIPDGPAFAQSLLEEYVRKAVEELPDSMSGQPKVASRWAKQNVKEQLVILEVLFWTMWGYVPCTGDLVEKIFETGTARDLGLLQTNTRMLLDEEGQFALEDCSTLWRLLMIEVLELETIGDPNAIEISADPMQKDIYTAFPESLNRIHDVVMEHSGDPMYVCTSLAWAYVLSRLIARAGELKELPESYRTFFAKVMPDTNRSYSKAQELPHKRLSDRCLSPNFELFNFLKGLLTKSPLFVTAAAWKRGSTVTDPNAIAFRSVLKGLIIALVELVPVEEFANLEELVDVWISLFGRSESQSISGICAQYWQADWHNSTARRAIFDVARSRFPIHFKPLIRLLRAMTASGFLDYDTLSIASHPNEGESISEEHDVCASHVFYYLDKLPTFTQVVPLSACSGAHALYEKLDRQGTTEVVYTNTRPIKLPGGSTLPARSIGRSLSDGGDYAVILWQHEHSGWKLILELLTDYVNRRRMLSGSGTNAGSAYQDVSFGRRGGSQVKVIRLEDVGIEPDEGGDEEVVMHCLDLVRSLIQDNPAQAEQLMQALETGEPVVAHTMTESQPPDLVQLTTMILEDALSQADPRTRTQPRPQLIISAMSVLSDLLALPNYSNRVWLYIRSTTALFGNERATGFASGALAAERATGHYTMTLGLLHLVQQLFREAAASVLPDNPRLQQLKEDVLLRAARFIHTEIWVEHLGWKYAQLGDRFEIGRRVTALYVEVLEHAPPTLEERPFAALSQAVVDVLLFKATSSTINPLVSSIYSGGQSLRNLYAARRYGDARRLISLLESHLRLTRLVLTYKQMSAAASRPCLLEQALCARISGGVSVHSPKRAKVDPIDVLALYVKERDAGTVVPVEAVRVLYALCASLSGSKPSPPTIIGHLSDPEATVAAFVRIVQHPYDDMALRNAVWSFISLGVDKEPALSSLFVTGKFRTPNDVKGKGKEAEKVKLPDKTEPTSAIDVARDVVSNWREIWELNPQLLSSVLGFLDVVWQHGLEHKAALETIREDEEFWDQVASIACEEVGPVPEYETTAYEVVDGVKHSSLHEVVAAHAYKTVAKSHAVHILGRDIAMHLQLHGRLPSAKKPHSFLKMEPQFKSQDQFNDLVCEAAPSSYDPQIYDQLLEQLTAHYRGLTLEQLRSQDPLELREFGDSFAFSVALLRSRLLAYARTADAMEDNTGSLVEKQVFSINLNLSLAHSQATLAESWQYLFQQVVPYLRGDASVRPIVVATSATISYDISKEDRSGDMMATIHGRRLSLLLSMLELAWFSSTDKHPEVISFMELVRNVHGIITNDAQPPAKSFLGMLSTPFHRTLLQIMYFCARHCRSLARRPKVLNAEQRLTVSSFVESSLTLVIDALKLVFESACTRVDPELDRDMELLVAVFEQCTSPDINPSSTLWLARCQETDIIRGSFNLYVHADLVGLSDLPLLLAKKRPLYAPHLLLFHMTLASNPVAAERVASDGVLAAYSNNFISAAISAGMIDVVLPELPGERSPAHRAYCSMLAIVAAVISALGRYNHYFDAEASGFVQLYGDQIIRALRWTIGDPITFALLEEIEQVVSLFQSIALSAPASATTNPVVDKVLRTFSDHALQLLQQLNYAITHPNHLTSLFEPLTAEERMQYGKDPPTMDPLKRPMIAHLVHRLYRLSSNIITTLIAISRAESVLLGREDEWPANEALIVPHSKVVLSEPASMGTLLELGNCTLDLLRELINRPAGQSLTATTSALSGPLDVREGVLTARRNLEGILVYAVTQLVMWLSKPEFDTSPPEDEENHSMSVDVQRADAPKERRVPRTSLTLGERLRRGMTGEMAADLQSLLSKAKPIIAKSNSVLGKESVDLTPVLSNFLHERIAVPA